MGDEHRPRAVSQTQRQPNCCAPSPSIFLEFERGPRRQEPLEGRVACLEKRRARCGTCARGERLHQPRRAATAADHPSIVFAQSRTDAAGTVRTVVPARRGAPVEHRRRGEAVGGLATCSWVRWKRRPSPACNLTDHGRQIVPPSGSGVALIALRDGDDRRLCLLVLSADTRFAGRQQWTVFSAQRTICAGRHAFAISSPWAIESMMEDSGEKCKVKA